MRAINLPAGRLLIPAIIEGWGGIAMFKSIINSRTLFVALLVMGVSCGDLRGGPATLPSGEGTEENQGVPTEDSGESESPAVTDPSDLDDPIDSGADKRWRSNALRQPMSQTRELVWVHGEV